jgi:3',5'-cyclic AMP phosphodiesterase CpdA
MGENLVLVHLSDIHFRNTGRGTEAILDEDLRRELQSDAIRVIGEGEQAEGVLVGGDIAFSGRKEEYHQAQEWLNSFCARLGCPLENVWVIPGNHDVDRRVLARSTQLQDMHERLRPRDPRDVDRMLDRYLSDPSASTTLLAPFAEFNAFARGYGCETTSTLHWEQAVQLNDGSQLRIRGVNSALVSGPTDDEGSNRLVLGRRQVVMPQEDVEGEPLEYLVLCHHPPQWLIDADDVGDYLRRARVVLFGHKHRLRTDRVGDALHVFAGAAQPSRGEDAWEPTYNILRLRVDEGPRRLSVQLWPRVWQPAFTRFGPGPTRSGQAYDQYELPLRPRVVASSPVPVQVIEEPVAIATVATSQPRAVAAPPEAPRSAVSAGISRRVVFLFFSLPFQVRLQIALDMNLLSDEDEGDEAELFRRVLHRVHEQGLADEFERQVEAQQRS